MTVLDRLAKLNIALPALAGPFGAYVPAKRAGNLVFVSGQLPMKDGKLIATGPVPSRCPIGTAKLAARQCAINGLAALQTVANLDQITGVARVGAFIASDPTFVQQPQIANSASELLLEILGDNGKHARAAVGTSVLPLDASVEVEFIFIIEP